MRLDLGGQVDERGLERAQEAKDGVPADASSSALDLGDVGRVDGEACGELLLRDVCAFAQFVERASENELILERIGGGVGCSSSRVRGSSCGHSASG